MEGTTEVPIQMLCHTNISITAASLIVIVLLKVYGQYMIQQEKHWDMALLEHFLIQDIILKACYSSAQTV